MLISMDWIQDFVPLPQEPREKMAERVTLATAEVESILNVNTHLKDIKIAQITAIHPHPQADRLNLVSFYEGSREKQVVCGAPNVKIGLKAPYAPEGVTLPGGLTLTPKKIRGQLSSGMLCSAAELELGPQESGLMELPQEAPVGQSLLDFFQMKEDMVLNIDNKSLTHRPDLWGHYGFARECATIWKQKLADPFAPSWIHSMECHFTKSPSPIRPQVDLNSAGLSYWALSLEGIQVGTSPQWIQERLKACGMRPINSIVDISNYVMLELGLPNHIFDREKIQGETLHIHRLEKRERFTTLDQEERPLEKGDTVISDAQGPLVIAGLMGGLQSGVTEKTRHILIEVANWKASCIRRTSTRLGLRTESSQRYEKSLDGNLCYRALLRILELILKGHPQGKVVGKAEYDGVDLSTTPTLTLTTSLKRIKSCLGKELTLLTVKTILQSLGFTLQERDGQLEVTVPSYRATKDVECEADLIEEVGRIMGYGHIDPVSPLAPVQVTRLDTTQVLHRKIQDYLVLKGRCLEVMTYPLIGESLLKKCQWPKLNEELVLLNALSQDHDRMRPSLLPSLLEVVALNQKYANRFQFFEIGRCYLLENGLTYEHSHMAMAFFDRKSNRFHQAINESENLLRSLHIPAHLVEKNNAFDNPIVSSQWPGCHPHQYQNIKMMGKNAGVILSVHPLMLKKFKIKGPLSLAIIDLTQVEKRQWPAQVHYCPLPKYPSSTFDCTIVCPPHTPIATILNSLKGVKIKELTSLKVVDVFAPQGEQKSVTLRATFSDPQQTLNNETVKACESALVAGLEHEGFPLKP